MKIEKIEPSKRKKGKIFIFLEDQSCVKITERELLEFSLNIGDDLDENQLRELRAAAGASNWKAKAAEIVSRQAVSRKSLERKLREKGAPEEDIISIADWLESVGALDDIAYAKTLARHCAEKGYGPARIRAKLYEKGVSKELWDDAMSDLPDDSDQIDGYIYHKLRGAKPDEKEKKRLTAGLLRRGFSWDDIKSAWARYGDMIDEELIF